MLSSTCMDTHIDVHACLYTHTQLQFPPLHGPLFAPASCSHRSYAHDTTHLEEHVFINFLCLLFTTSSMWLSEDFALTTVVGIHYLGLNG